MTKEVKKHAPDRQNLHENGNAEKKTVLNICKPVCCELILDPPEDQQQDHVNMEDEQLINFMDDDATVVDFRPTSPPKYTHSAGRIP